MKETVVEMQNGRLDKVCSEIFRIIRVRKSSSCSMVETLPLTAKPKKQSTRLSQAM